MGVYVRYLVRGIAQASVESFVSIPLFPGTDFLAVSVLARSLFEKENRPSTFIRAISCLLVYGVLRKIAAANLSSRGISEAL